MQKTNLACLKDGRLTTLFGTLGVFFDPSNIVYKFAD